MPNHVSANCGTWRVLPEGMSQMFRLLYLGNGWADCVEIWHALGDPLVTAYTIVTGGIIQHVRTCRGTPTPRFCISETAWPIVFKFGMWVGGSLTKWGIPAQIDQPRGRFNIIMSAISIKFAVLGYSWALITNIKLVFEYILPFRNYSLRRF